ncbi:[protein-PII] uridylyltransferase [Chromatiales bacterium (ex Bugula neritina AB1)]|nr:[protein-PII] uridylyltransferase [Chromatiales bacterium (ex Bugula neritina AB1)]
MVQKIESRHSSISAYREALRDARSTLDTLFNAGAPAADLIGWQTAVTDTLIRHLWAVTLPQAAQDFISLIAVGGYGRAELHPHSDIDILILTASDFNQADEAIGQFITALWDLGLDVGHSVRDINQCLDKAKAEVTVITNLLESRHLCGSLALFNALQCEITPAKLWPIEQFFMAKKLEQQARHIKFHGSAYRLEPNLKESPGGLRDIQTIVWLLIRHYGNDDPEVLVEEEFLTKDELNELLEARDYLWRVRFLLHSKSNRKEDRLLFDYQRDLAKDFGHLQDSGNEAVEAFMQRYYRTVTGIERLNEMLMQLLEDFFVATEKSKESKRVGKHFNVVNHYIEVRTDSVFADYPPAMLELFQAFAASEDIQGIGARTLRLLRSNLHRINKNFRTDVVCRELFLRLFREPQKITRKLRLMNRYGVMAKYLPDFEEIVGRMQYDLFHIYTVDEHTLMVIRNLRRFAIPYHNEEYPHCSELMQQITKPELLYLAGLFHDIAKGRNGDHSILGAEDAALFCKSHGLNAMDSKLIVWIVQHHLAMSTTAQRKDISDPEVILEFARFVGSMRYLNFLYLLTVADIRGTNPELWNSWKENLLRQLYDSTEQALKRGLDSPIDKLEIIEEKKQEALTSLAKTRIHAEAINAVWDNCDDNYFLQYTADEICWHTVNISLSHPIEPLVLLRRETSRGSTEIFISVDDYDLIFSDLVTAIDQLNLTVVNAQILTSTHGRTLDTFFVLERDGESIQDNSRLEHIYKNLSSTLASPTTLHRPKPMISPRRLRHFDFKPVIQFDNSMSNDYTSLFLKVIDRPGLLSAIGYSFAQNSIRVLSANITTLGETAEDAFFIQDRNRSKITDTEALKALRFSLLNNLKEQ